MFFSGRNGTGAQIVIACIGWGSLIWDLGGLCLASAWHEDGPILPIEFGRQSKKGNVTLVIAAGAGHVTTLWAQLQVDSLEEARISLARREGTTLNNIGVWPANRASLVADDVQQVIASWAVKRKLGAAVWTALPPKWNGEAGRMPSEAEVIEYLRRLTDPTRSIAEEYVRKTPRQVRTSYRPAIERELGWMPAVI